MMRTMLNSITKLKRLTDQQATRLHSQSKDIEEMSSILKLIATTNTIFSGTTFSDMSIGFKEVSTLSEKCANLQQNAICERFVILIDILTAHR